MLTGSLVALATPMHHDGRIDFDTFGALIERHIAAGTDGLVIVGTT
ncbi:MAG: dihydrodipicolinate synthase family protein, partial [Zoogloeaceae bacterium]|nr:dihydrodipicolinate synthase family protein [Zoogloeaceae bacterium]MDR0996865.1 dihydrodipicolinate synthase family protein [Zoogloeaceae bacterium]